MSNLFKNPLFLLSPLLFLAVFWLYALLSTYEEARDRQNDFAQSLRLIKTDLEILSRRSEILTLPFRTSLGEKPEDAGKILREMTESQRAILWIQVVSPTGNLLAGGGQSQVADIFKTNETFFSGITSNEERHWFEVNGVSLLVMESEVRGLFQNAVARIRALADPWPQPAGNAFRSFNVSAKPAGSFAVPIFLPGFHQAFGFDGKGVHYSQEFATAGKKFFLGERMTWPAFLTVFLIFEILFLLSLRIFLSLRENFQSLSAGRAKREDVLSNDVAVLVNEEMTPVLRQVQFDLRKLIRRLSQEKDSAGVRDIHEVTSGEKSKTEEELRQEEEMYAKIELPDGKKTALIEDPGIRKEIVFDFDLDDRFTELKVDLAALQREKDEEKSAPGEFEEGKTKLVEDGEAKAVVWDKDLPLVYEEIPYT